LKLIDTSVAVDHLLGRTAATALLERLIGSGDELVASELTRFEVLAGAREPERPALEAFFSVPTWIAVEEEIARLAGELASRYRRSHSGIDAADYLIAATAIAAGADLLTTNVRHFPMFPALRPAY
jgi:predicted nucleic acid-binding protein